MSGYTELGGSLFSQGLAGFVARSLSAIEDIAPTREILISRSRVLDMSVPIARAAIDRIVAGVVGSGLMWDNPTRSNFFEGEALERYKETVGRIKKRLCLWSMSHACDAQRRSTFGQLQRIVCRNWLLSGDVFLVRRPPMDGRTVSDWRVIEADRCATPFDMASNNALGIKCINPETGNVVIEGVELDCAGAPVAYHFRDSYYDDTTCEFTRIPAFDVDGSPLVLHIFSAERPDQYRGVPLLAPIIECIYGTACYAQSELQAAILESCFSLFFETDTDPTANPFAPETDLDKPLIPDPEYKLSPESRSPLGIPGMVRDTSVIGPGESRRLKPGEKVHTVDPKRPNSGYEAFIKAQNGMIAAAIGVPLQVLQATYDGTTYASARAATVEAWRTFRVYRNIFIELFIKPVLNVFCRETLRDMYPNDTTELADIIALDSTWTGPSAVCLDPTKELQAYETAYKMGLVSLDEVAQSIYGHSAANDAEIEALREVGGSA